MVCVQFGHWQLFLSMLHKPKPSVPFRVRPSIRLSIDDMLFYINTLCSSCIDPYLKIEGHLSMCLVCSIKYGAQWILSELAMDVVLVCLEQHRKIVFCVQRIGAANEVFQNTYLGQFSGYKVNPLDRIAR